MLFLLCCFSVTVSAASDYPVWEATTIYNNGEIVTHEGEYWEAQWWTQNQEPGTTGQWGPWIEISGSEPVNPEPVDPVTSAEGFYVEGTTLYDASGEPFVIRGINYAHTWYKDDLQEAIPVIDDTGANSVRVVLSNGDQYTRDDVNSVKNIISLLEQHDLITILEVHDSTGSDSLSDLSSAVDYWKEIKDVLIGNEDTVIVNIANEWFGSWDGHGWAQGYEQAIPELRNAGIKNTLIIDAAGGGNTHNRSTTMVRMCFKLIH